MELKKIELNGFKSFADKTTIDFDQGVTAIVGPNGSGKSNVIEALRWVMGEQSARNLRGGKMHDVIFSGTHARKPVNIAEVTLLLDNSDFFLPIDFEEVSISRRLHRNGESEYRLNKQPCRLKDIVDLFMDSGLGKESFSIISQGQVEAIFNSKAEDRRSIFEEAAGVLKYKQRKKAAEKKLDETQGNLDRVQDILYELEAQVDPLKEQASLANAYVGHKKELTDLDISVTVTQIEQFSLDSKELNEKISQSNKNIQQINETIRSKEEATRAIKVELHQIESNQQIVQNNYLEAVKNVERYESQKELVHYKETNAEEQIAYYDQQLVQNNQELTELINVKKEVKAKIETKNKELKKSQSLVTQLKKSLSQFDRNSQRNTETLREEYFSALQKSAALKNELNYFSKEKEQREFSLNKLQLEIEKLSQEKIKLEINLENITQHHQEITAELDELTKSFRQISNKIQLITRDLDSDETKMYDSLRVLQQVQANEKSLQQIVNNYSGYFQGVQTVMKQKDQVAGIIGTVADVIQVSKKYEIAIDTVLGSASQFIVMDNETHAQQAIQLLKKIKGGRATFLPLTTVSQRNISDSLLSTIKNSNGFIGVAAEVVDYDSKLQPIIKNLLGNTLIAENLQAATEISKKLQYKFRVVSLEGDLMNAGGSMTGGQNKNSSSRNLISQKNKIKQLSLQKKTLQDELEKRESSVKKLKSEKKKLEEQFNSIRTQGEEKRLAEQKEANKKEAIEERMQQLNKQMKALRYEKGELSEDSLIAENKVGETSKEIESTLSKIKDLKQEMDLFNLETDEKEKRKMNLIDKVSQERERKIKLEQIIKNFENELNHLTKQIEKAKNTIEDLENVKKLRSTTKNSLSIEEIIKHLEYFKAEKENLNIQLHQMKIEKDSKEKDREQIEEAIQSLENKKENYLLEQSDLTVAYNRKDVGIDHLLVYLQEEYQVSFEEAKLAYRLKEELEIAKKKVKLIKRSIDEIGPVNLNSIDEYHKVKSRWEFLSEQQADLINAKEQLYETMGEMDAEVSQRFKKTFMDIKERFSQVFPQMFGGGKAELKLTDPEDLLSSGVEIIAQPPGKKLQQLSLLSGGERALTAISLLFSIIQVKPIPFCVLDEVEAALDEANVARFGKYLHTFETDTQFIVITHRKGTMEEADSLYGITMQEKGVSKIVSVRLQEVDMTSLKN
ncbi:chromosome segregation protein SMC [Lacticigenium naphthae]|uniref:chromosome segregation protein SMC n=1 Tax=Lacticigenium naphthae TaxID=515351 RepID=UPI0004116111|nr:chromosome segregation protein SMC [Lacticigenium naphthae]